MFDISTMNCNLSTITIQLFNNTTILYLAVGETSFSGWTSVRTKSARPSGLRQPLADVLNSTAVEVMWSAPESVNGVLERWLFVFC